jgi:hypothetical protein
VSITQGTQEGVLGRVGSKPGSVRWSTAIRRVFLDLMRGDTTYRHGSSATTTRAARRWPLRLHALICAGARIVAERLLRQRQTAGRPRRAVVRAQISPRAAARSGTTIRFWTMAQAGRRTAAGIRARTPGVRIEIQQIPLTASHESCDRPAG